METSLLEYFATCPKGFEELAAGELKRLRAQRVRPLKGGVAFFGDLACGYRVCLWSRIASRVTRVLARVDAHSAEALYDGARAIAWESFVAPGATIAVSAHGVNDALRNSQFTALKVKDALCDRLRMMQEARPDVAPYRPDVPVWVTVHGKKATVSIDFAGESLHHRGYRAPGKLPAGTVKEGLAAGMLVWGGWDRVASPGVRRAAANRAGVEGTAPAPAFVDPSCADGVIVLEAAMMAADRAPGLSRDYWGFEGCADFDADAFDEVLSEADERFEAGLETLPVMVGCATDEAALETARAQARRLGLATHVQFVCAPPDALLDVFADAGIEEDAPGFIALSAPSGLLLFARGGSSFYEGLSRSLGGLTEAWGVVVLASDASVDTSLGYEAERTLAVYNGNVEAELRSYRLGTSFMVAIPVVTLEGVERTVPVTSDHAAQFAGRLRKMARERRKWARKHAINAYRIYDADLPDYAVSVDLFLEEGSQTPYLLISEYQAPRDIDPNKAARRFRDAVAVARALLDVPEERVFTRVRRQDRGGSQYRQDDHRSHTVIVEEAGHPFELDLSGYLDTGLFLDHRITRALVGERAENAAFLNLFAYTGTATVYAAAGHATSTTTVDMSKTYLDWARRNMERSGFRGRAHRFICADVLSWVEQAADAGERFDLVFVDPPTFSNSKTMGERTWDIQRDHAALLAHVRALLAPGGTIVFSGNLRSFKLDRAAVEEMGLDVEDLTAATIPEDFARNPRIHFCYLLTDAAS